MTDELVNALLADAANLAVLFVGVPNQEMLVALYSVREEMKARLQAIMQVDLATFIAELFVTAVAGRKAELEAEQHKGMLQ